MTDNTEEQLEPTDMELISNSVSQGLHDIASSLSEDASADKRMLIDAVDGVSKSLMEIAGAIKYKADLELIRELSTSEPKHLDKIERVMNQIDKKRLANAWLD